MADIFISYHTSDRPFVQRLYNELRKFRVRGFMDAEDVAAGESFSRRLREAVSNADAILVVLSSSASRSSFVLAEVGLAISLNKLVIPVLAPGEKYEESAPPQLFDRQVIDATKLPIEEIAARVVAAATNTPVDVALNQVTSRIRYRQRILIATVVLFALLAAMATVQSYFALQQRAVAEEAAQVARSARLDAERARIEEEILRKRLTEITGRSATLAVAPDGRTLATGNRDGTVTIWDARSGRILISLRGHSGVVSGLAYSPDGSRLAVASWDKTLSIWNIATGSQALLLKGHTDAVASVQFSSDGTRLYSRSLDGTVREWDASTGREIGVTRVPS
jgi:type II secretory pathway pseudopilin PulG